MNSALIHLQHCLQLQQLSMHTEDGAHKQLGTPSIDAAQRPQLPHLPRAGCGVQEPDALGHSAAATARPAMHWSRCSPSATGLDVSILIQMSAAHLSVQQLDVDASQRILHASSWRCNMDHADGGGQAFGVHLQELTRQGAGLLSVQLITIPVACQYRSNKKVWHTVKELFPDLVTSIRRAWAKKKQSNYWRMVQSFGRSGRIARLEEPRQDAMRIMVQC